MFAGTLLDRRRVERLPGGGGVNRIEPAVLVAGVDAALVVDAQVDPRSLRRAGHRIEQLDLEVLHRLDPRDGRCGVRADGRADRGLSARFRGPGRAAAPFGAPIPARDRISKSEMTQRRRQRNDRILADFILRCYTCGDSAWLIFQNSWPPFPSFGNLPFGKAAQNSEAEPRSCGPAVGEVRRPEPSGSEIAAKEFSMFRTTSTTATTARTGLGGKARRIVLGLGLLGIAGIAMSAAPAMAHDDHDRDGRGREYREHEFREHEFREHEFREHEFGIARSASGFPPGTSTARSTNAAARSRCRSALSRATGSVGELSGTAASTPDSAPSQVPPSAWVQATRCPTHPRIPLRPFLHDGRFGSVSGLFRNFY